MRNIDDIAMVIVRLPQVLQQLSSVLESMNMDNTVVPYLNKTLLSFGEVIPALKRGQSLDQIVSDFVQMADEEVQQILVNLKTDHLELYIDSGGYQALTGRLTKDIADRFIDAYHQMIPKLVEHFRQKYGNKVQVKAFTLDIPPAADQSKPNVVDIPTSLTLTKHSYQETAQTLYVYRDNIIVVVHIGFRAIAQTFYDILDENPRLLEFTAWSTSTMRKYANSAQGTYSYIAILYAFLRSLGLDKTTVQHIHFLGVSAPKFVLPLMYLQQISGITKATYDSTSLIMGAIRGTVTMWCKSTGSRTKIDLKENFIPAIFERKLKELGLEDLTIRNDDDGRLTRETLKLLIYLSLETQIQDELIAKELAKQIAQCVQSSGSISLCLLKVLGSNPIFRQIPLDYNVNADVQLLRKLVNSQIVEREYVLKLIERHLEPLPMVSP